MTTNPFRDWFEKAQKKDPELTQQKLADDLGVKHQTLWNWLHDKTLPDSDVLEAIHQRTKIPAQVLIEWTSKDR